MSASRSIIIAAIAVLSGATASSCNDEGRNTVDVTNPNEVQPRALETPAAPSQPADSPTVAPQAGPPRAGPPRAGDDVRPVADYCPMAMPGVELEVSDATKAVALTFVTSREEDVAELRTRARNLGQMYEAHSGRPMMGGQGMGMGGKGMRQGMGGGQGRMMGGGMGHPPELHATFTEIDRGARVELMPADDAKLDELRTFVRAHEQRMRSGRCQIMMQPSATEQAPPTDPPTPTERTPPQRP